MYNENEEMTQAALAEKVAVDAIDLKNFEVEQLEELVKAAKARMRGLRMQRLNELRREIRKTAEDLGMTIEQVVGLEKGTKSSRRGAIGKVAPKYQNPDNPAQTWTGRGQKPVWLRDMLAQGYQLDDLKIAVKESEGEAEAA